MNAINSLVIPSDIVDRVVCGTDLVEAVDQARRLSSWPEASIRNVRSVAVDRLQDVLDVWAYDNGMPAIDAASGLEPIVQQIIHEAWTEIERREQVGADEEADHWAAGDMPDGMGGFLANDSYRSARR